MRFLKLIGFSVVILFIIVSLLGLLFPSKVIVSRAIDITANKDSIVQYVNNVHQWKLWIDGVNDTTSKYLGGNKIQLGNTIATITAASLTQVKSEWVMKNQEVQNSELNIFSDSAKPNVVVQWQFTQYIKWYPWERFSSMMSDKIIGTMLEKNLNNLKQLVEGKN